MSGCFGSMMTDDKGLIFSNRTGKWLYSMSLFMLEAFLLFFCWNALTDWDEASFFFETQPRVVLALLVVSVTVFLWFFLRIMRRFLQTRSLRSLKWISAALLLAALSLQLVFLLHYRNLYLFDNAFVTGGASTLAAGEGPAAQARYYFSVYPNQNAYIVLTAFLWKLGSTLGLSRGQIPFLLNTVNLICLDLTFWLVYQTFCLCRRESAPADRVWVILLLCMNPFLYIGVCYYYTIVLSMPFLMLMVYLSVRYLVGADARAVPLGVAGVMGAAFGAGYLLRATTVIPMIAILFTCVYFKRWKKQLWVMLITAALCILLLGRWNADYIGIDTKDTAFPALHWVMMSMTPPGSHNEADEAYTASFVTKQQKQEGVRQRLAEKIAAMSPVDMLHLFVSKLRNTWGSGSSGYTVYLENCMETDGLYEWVFGQHKDGSILFHQSYYLLLMLLFLRHLTCSRKRRDVPSYVGQLTYLGGILFYLLWETSPQYSLPFLPLLMTGAAMGAQECEAGQPNMRRSLRFARSASGILGFAVLLLFYVCNFSTFTRAGSEWSHPVVTQILANDEVTVGAGTLFRQEFTADQPFNRIIFQYTSPDEGCEAVYEAALLDAQDHVLMQREISLKDAPSRNAAIYDFEEILPQGREHYRLQIRMLDGSKTDRIGIITYSMGHYDAYPGGSCLLGSKELETDMLLAVSRVYNGPYLSLRRYLFAGVFFTGCFLLFLFLAFCCKIESNGEGKDLSHGN